MFNVLGTTIDTVVKPSVRPGNSKLGRIPNWSIPAIVTCVGSTAACRLLCYAANGFFRTSTVRESQYANWTLSRLAVFVAWMVQVITRQKTRVFRIHVSGDFYSVEYTRKWLEIVRLLPGVRFYVYTRSWRDPEIEQVLWQLAAMPNIQLWYSCDLQTGKPARLPPGVKLCYLLLASEDEPLFQTDLIFRDDKHRPGVRIKRVRGVLVCPAEQMKGQHATCERCGICFDRDRAHLLEPTAVYEDLELSRTSKGRISLPLLVETPAGAL